MTLPPVDERYEFQAVFARAGQGRIWRAFDRRLGREVAIKELLARDESALRRFQREVEVTARLQHPAIVPIHDRGQGPDGAPWFCMKLVRGRTLAACVDEARTFRGRLALLPHVIAVCDAMAAAHSQRIVHRDLKPQNVLVGAFGETVVIDWGLAREMDRDDSDVHAVPGTSTGRGLPSNVQPDLTQPGDVMGTLAYMPPEQANGDPADERSDVYALGTILYHVLAGRPPYMADTLFALLARVADGRSTPLREVVPEVSLDLVAIVERAMAREPADRYESALEMSADLARFRAQLPVHVRHYRLHERVMLAVRRYRLLSGVAMIAVVLMLGGTFSALKVSRDAATESLTQELREKLSGLAAAAAAQVEPDAVARITGTGALDDPAQRREVERLVGVFKRIKQGNPRVQYVWIMRHARGRPGYTEFVVDDTLFDSPKALDQNKNGKVDDDEAPAMPGQVFEEAPQWRELLRGFERPGADIQFDSVDRWGVALSGYAPIRDARGYGIAVLGVDMKSDRIAESFRRTERAFTMTAVLVCVAAVLLVVLVLTWIVNLWQHGRLE